MFNSTWETTFTNSAIIRALILIALSSSLVAWECSNADRPNSNLNGVQIGVITYSWRSMPSTAEDILKYCLESGISSIELMGNVAEAYAGLPSSPPRPRRGQTITDEQQQAREKAREEQRQWRLSASMEKYKELRKMFDDAGIRIHLVKFAPADWSDEEIDYAFRAAKALGAVGITNEISHEACRRLAKFAEKHDMFAVFHNHLQPGEPGFDFADFLAYSAKNMLNFDVGHYVGATGRHPNEMIEKFHDRIISLHLKDKTSKDADVPNKNRPWGEGDTPLGEILQLIRKNKWPIVCDIEIEYAIPEGSNAVKEAVKCVNYCRKALTTD